MTLPLIVLLPFIGTLLPLWSIRSGSRSLCAWATALPPLIGLVALFSHAATVFDGGVVTWQVPWLPALGLNLAFMIDGFGFLFAGLVLGIGLLVILYARYYLSADDPMGRFFAMLLAFMGAMLGIVLANNILLLVVFWELTSITSFLLIGYWRHSGDARRGARMALTMTAAGGLCLLAGAILLGHIVGSFELRTILAAGDAIRADPLYIPTLLLILAGAFTKSAQIPVHFWLPDAMAAPTPVSAYLHSATMVKAGVFLLARLFPALAGSDTWFFVVGGVGLATLVFGAYAAFFKNDIKALLAYSTISHLGLITLLFGLGTPAGAVAGVFHIINHASFKASLFMLAGIIDHETGTRDLRQLGGLRHYLPVTMALTVIAAAAMAGLPLLNGFLSKEMLFAETVAESHHLGAAGWLLPAAATLGGLLSAAYSLRLVHQVFFGEFNAAMPKTPHEPPHLMRAPVELLVIVCIVVGVAPQLVIAELLQTAVGGVLIGDLPEISIKLWHGFNLPLAMSAIALLGAALMYAAHRPVFRAHETLFPALHGRRVFDGLIRGTIAGTAALSRALDSGRVQRNVTYLLIAAVAMGAIGAWGGTLEGDGATTAASWPPLVIWAMSTAALIGLVVGHRNRFVALVLMGVIGLLSAVTFTYLSAPDLALTQLSVEVVSTILLLLALNLLPTETPRESSPGRRLRDAAVAIAGGSGIAALAYAVMTRPFESISDYQLAQSVPGGGGHNVVNVILVDFRGFDTFGEITVLGIAAIGVYAMIASSATRVTSVDCEPRHPRMLLVGSRVMMPLLAGVAAYIFLRGHNAPGGGFIAGLVAAVALVTQYMASGVVWTEERSGQSYFPLIGTGLCIAGITGVASWLFGYPFLTSAYDHVHWPVVGDFEIASATGFDLGVFLTVVGSVVLMLSQLGKQQSEPAEANE